ncbi:MAG TPA: DUF5719 family protein, partial [Microthrixaceae bacterium]|nr:DUF5719 family protein [Microthrixaceae bacterium]
DGIVVPAGTTKVVDLGEQVQRRDQFSVEVKAKSGRILAETVQLLNLEATDKVPAVHGLRLLPGVANARQVWTFAGGFKDPGAHEKIVVQNPGADPASVSVQVVPYGAGDMPPEPFLFEVPARRYFVLDLTGEGRIPDVGFHSIRVESSEGDPVVAVRTSDVSAGPPAKPEGFTGGMRPAIDRGATTSLGSPFDARSWLIPSVSTGQGNSPIALIHNPGSGIVRVTVTAATDGGAPVDVLKDAEVAAGDGLAVGLSSGDLGGKALRYYKVVATGPISVDQFKTFASVKDYSIGPALPITP